MLTNNDLRDILRKECLKAGGAPAWAERHNCSRTNICEMISGKREVSERVMNILGYEWAIVKQKK